MNHTDVEEQNLVDRYVMGKLSADEAERFEDHYLSCPECLDRLELAESMQRGFRRAVGQDAARLAAARQLALVAWLSRLGRSRQMAALVMALLVVAILPAGLALRQIGERDR
ncbi:MAG TPA: zf-HC2 domain-containing protein, partial [Thermoanaerobaculia bacterium]